MGMTTNKKDLYILIFKLMLFAAIILFFFDHIMPQYEHIYTASLVDKAERLESIDEPKIVLIGDSNVAFGFDSQRIEERFGMPVVNMGLHGGIGAAFHDEMAKMNVTQGDIYVICHIDYSDQDLIDDPVLAWSTIENHKQLWKLIRGKDIYPMLKAYPTYLNKALEVWSRGTGNGILSDTAYSREAFNEYGDVVFERECKMDGDVNEVVPQISETCIHRLNLLNDYLQERGAKAVIAGYPIIVDGQPSEQFTGQILQFEQELNSRCDCEVISDYQDYFYDKEYFYDTQHHLTNEGAGIRTEQLIHDLEYYIQ